MRRTTHLVTLAITFTLLSSCIFKIGVPMADLNNGKIGKSRDFKIKKITPESGFIFMALENPLTIQLDNSFSSDSFGTVTIKAPAANSEIKLVNGQNGCTMRYIKGALANDTLLIEGLSNILSTWTDYRELKLSGFKDYKGNSLSPITDSTYSFSTSGIEPVPISLSPAAGSMLKDNRFTLLYNRAMNGNSWGRINLQSLDGNSFFSLEAGINSKMSLSRTRFEDDTILITLTSPLAPNTYLLDTVSDFKARGDNINSVTHPASTFGASQYEITFPGLLAHYNFNSNYLDRGGQGYDLTVAAGSSAGTYVIDRVGNPANAHNFNGNNAFTSSNLKRLYGAGQSSTITIWFSPAIGLFPLPPTIPILSKTGSMNKGGLTNQELQLELFQGFDSQFRLRLVSGESGALDLNGFYEVMGNTPLQANSWYHAAIVFTESSIELYLNGQLESSTVIAEGKSRNCYTYSSLLVGRANVPTPRHYEGAIDELKIYNYSLSAQEIENEYNSTKSGP